jgi:mannitol/fructose-specific phosphotransferase system IIA component (Ntr-type)
MMNINKGLSQARKDDIVLSINENDNVVTIVTAKADMPFVKQAVYEVVMELYESIQKLKESSPPHNLQKVLLDSDSRNREKMLSVITSECTSVTLKGETKEEIFNELVDMLYAQGKISDKDMVLKDIWERENVMSTAIDHGIAMPHARTEGADNLSVAVGIKKEGVDLKADDGGKTWLFVLSIAPKKKTSPYLEFLAAIGTHLTDEPTRNTIYNAPTREVAAELLRTGERRGRQGELYSTSNLSG